MNLDITKLVTNSVDEISLDTNVSFPQEIFSNSEIKELKNVKINGTFTKLEDNIYLKAVISGEMLIEDAISLEDVFYPFKIDFNDIINNFIKNNQNTLDIIEFLWENIVLEVPLRYTIVKDINSFKGDGWELREEKEQNNANNPFNELLKEFGKE